jgi:iron uptake system component EfeO
MGKVITVSAQACGTGWQHPAAGVQTIQIRNTANAPQDVALIDADTGAVYARLEAIGPSTTRPMQVDVGSGAYAFECSGQNFGDRIGRAIRVGGHARGGVSVTPVDVTDMLTAISQSRAYVTSGLSTLAGQTAVLAAKIKAGDLAGARAAWLSAHLTYERLGRAYGMFGDYDEEIDGEPFGLPEGVRDPGFTGFYRLEYGLWHGQSAAELTGPADRLDHDVRALTTAFPGIPLLPAFGLGDLALRTHEILEHVRFWSTRCGSRSVGRTTSAAARRLPRRRPTSTAPANC